MGTKLRMLRPELSEARALELGRMIGMVMAVLVDNLEYLPEVERRRLRAETYSMLSRYVDAEGPAVAGQSRGHAVRKLSRTARARPS
jgi:hypothetical protein